MSASSPSARRPRRTPSRRPKPVGHTVAPGARPSRNMASVRASRVATVCRTLPTRRATRATVRHAGSPSRRPHRCPRKMIQPGEIYDADHAATPHHRSLEIHDAATLRAHLTAGLSLRGVRLQGMDLRGFRHEFLARTDLRGLAVLGGTSGQGRASPDRAWGDRLPGRPGRAGPPYRAELYQPADLCKGARRGGMPRRPTPAPTTGPRTPIWPATPSSPRCGHCTTTR